MYSFPSRRADAITHTLSMSKPHVSWYIKARRLAMDKDLSYQAMADRLGVNKSRVGHWMTGRHQPSLAMLEKIAAMLETTAADLISEDRNYITNPHELDAAETIREMPEEYRAQAVAMLKAFKASLQPPQED
jgi:transcriptional regulator with XRE-family HTH domain